MLASFMMSATCTLASSLNLSSSAYGDVTVAGSTQEGRNVLATPMATAWIEAGRRSLYDSIQINLPFSEAGVFQAAEPQARSYTFAVKDGQVLKITGMLKAQANARIFLDLFVWKDTTWTQVTHADSALTLSYEFDRDAQCLLRLQRPDEARPLLEGVVASNPKHDYGHSLMAYAETLAAKGEVDQAIAVWLRVTENHTYPRARVQLAELYLKTGKKDLAREQLQEVLTDAPHAPAFQRKRERPWVRRATRLMRQVK